MNNPLVSAIITTYKREISVLEEAINSVEKQSYGNIEIIVVDDNPNESELCSRIRELCDRHQLVKYMKQDGNRGACAARNLGILNSKGLFIGCLDDDDLWLPSKIQRQLSMFEKPNVGIVYCNGIRLEEDSADRSVYNPLLTNMKTVSFKDMLRADVIGTTSNPLVRRECFEKVGLFWEEQPARQDYEMWLRITQKYDAVGINEELFVHRIHAGEQISKNYRKSYIGYHNIYKRYKNFYKQDPIAERYILKNMIVSNKGINPSFLFYGFKYFINIYTKKCQLDNLIYRNNKE